MSAAPQAPSLPRRHTRTPGVLHSLLAIAFLAALIPIVITATGSSTPSIAEFAPQAQQLIRQAQPELGSRFGAGGGGQGGAGQASPSPSPVATALPAGTTLLHCVGDPPRQIEDPQSPPCVAYWAGDNGGSTAPGVTKDFINVIVTNGAENNAARVTADFQRFFNKRFEFYGRRLNFINPAGGVSFNSCPQARSVADNLTAQYQPFAIVGSQGSADYDCFYDELAHDRVISAGRGVSGTAGYLQSRAPYIWNYGWPVDEMFAQWGEMACSSLAGHDAQFAFDPVLASSPRKFGVIIQEATGGPDPFDETPLKNALAACGESLDVAVAQADGTDPGLASYSAQTATAVTQMKTDHVTTVFCFCPVISSEIVSSSATSQAYYPEWLMTDINGLNVSIKAYWPNADQRHGLLGMFSYPAQVPYPSEPLNWALEEVDGGFMVSGDTLSLNQDQEAYWTLLLLASGIQMAGPRLTPATFGAALHRTVFPNPPNPYAQGSVGFPGTSPVMIQDALMARWSDAGIDPHYDDGGAGAWCYLNGASRYAFPNWPRSVDFSTTPCLSWPAGT